MKESVLITGATGFIGRHLIERLSMENVNIIAVSRNTGAFKNNPKVNCIYENLGNMDAITAALDKYNISTCFHLAWEGIPDFSFEYCRQNLEYGLNILEVCKKLEIKKLIVSGSCLEYKRVNGFVSETDSLDRDSLFAVTKNTLHDFAHIFCRENNITLYWLRLFYVIGVGQRRGSALPYLINCIDNGRLPELKTPYDANDFISAEDVADALAVFWKENPRQEVYNIGTGKLTMAGNLAVLVKEIYCGEENNKIEKQVPENWFGADCKAVLNDTTWKPSRKIEDVVREMIKESPRTDEERIQDGKNVSHM